MLFGTFFGKIWGVHLVLCLLQLVYWRLPGRRSHTPALALSTLALATMAPVGHVAMFTGIEGGLMVLNQMLHLLCAGAWLGGLFLLIWMSFKPQLVDLKDSMRQFSLIGVPLVGIILISGVINTRLITGQFLPSGSAFATVLAFKAAAVLAMLGFALYNRYQARRVPPAGMRTALIAEALCGVFALGAVAWLGTLAPVPMGAA
ncbi:CopD family protein [Pseudomonas sp. KNUC1026]|uniref:CopD family protein n=1 Tax=Pseudomonas sp. KNUC1026 TaxID=2893890 RepID=UPI001F4196C0|nr:CopD family protein [Pseudomonas sp. KNUC1026]UFH51305.1 CopD family protein [Pseudomonas sp. KNUC1026]